MYVRGALFSSGWSGRRRGACGGCTCTAAAPGAARIDTGRRRLGRRRRPDEIPRSSARAVCPSATFAQLFTWSVDRARPPGRPAAAASPSRLFIIVSLCCRAPGQRRVPEQFRTCRLAVLGTVLFHHHPKSGIFFSRGTFYIRLFVSDRL